MRNLKIEWISKDLGYGFNTDDNLFDSKLKDENDSYLVISDEDCLKFLVDYVRSFVEKTH